MFSVLRRAALAALVFGLFVPTSLHAQAQLSVNGVAAPSGVTVTAGATVAVTVNGASGSATDWVALHAVGAADGSYVDWRYLNGATVPPPAGLTEATLTFSIPVAPGVYEFRLFANNGFERLATSGMVSVVLVPGPQVDS